MCVVKCTRYTISEDESCNLQEARKDYFLSSSQFKFPNFLHRVRNLPMDWPRLLQMCVWKSGRHVIVLFRNVRVDKKCFQFVRFWVLEFNHVHDSPQMK